MSKEYHVHVIEIKKIFRYLYYMRRLLYLYAMGLGLAVSAQSVQVRNVNDEYFTSSFYKADISKNELHESVRDKTGLYWFQYLTEIKSFDGANWKSYELKSIIKNPFRINDIAVTDDGNVWLATEFGIYVFDRTSQYFIPATERFPGMQNIPQAVTCFLEGPAGKLIFLGFQSQGFFLLDIKTKQVAQISIDGISRVGTNSENVVIDRSGTIWGTTEDYKGIWNYNQFTGVMRCSWKGQLPEFGHKRFNNFINLTFSKKENIVWIAHVKNRYLERMNLRTGKSNFYSFSGNLEVQPDSNALQRYRPFMVKTDRDNNEWINIGGKYLVKLDADIKKMEFLTNEFNSFPIGAFNMFEIEKGTDNDRNNILFWVVGYEKLSIIKKRGNAIRHIYFDSLSPTGIKPIDYVQDVESRKKMFLEKGRNDEYFLLQKDAGRPKLIKLDKDHRIKNVAFKDEWKKYPAYFSSVFNPDTLYVAILTPEIKPLDFRNVVFKDFKVDLNTFNVSEIKLDFKQRVWHYGVADSRNVYWLYSNGSLYSYDPGKDIFDSMFICKPGSKKGSPISFINGYDYPTLLHKNSSTFWISFATDRELYKVNLKTRRVEKIFRTCLDRTDCNIPGGVYNMYTFDSTRIYFKSSIFSMLFDTRTDSVIEFSEIFKKEIPVGIPRGPVGSGVYGDWLCFAVSSQIILYNVKTKLHKVLLQGEDFKWPLSLFHSRPLLNDHGEMILMASGANQGFLSFKLDSAISPNKPGPVKYSFIRLDGKNLLVDSLLKNGGLILKYDRYNNIQMAFSDYSVFDANKTSYQYALYKSGDTVWNKIIGKPELTFTDLSPGNYQLLLRASNVYGDYSEKISALKIAILPPFWQTWWFRLLVLAAVGLVFYGLYRYRVQELKRLQIIRNNIARDLHDDIGSTLNSISIYSEVAKQQAGKEIPALDLIGANSRKIIESMSDIVWTINPENDSFEKIIVRMRSFAYQLLKAKKVEYTFEADEKLNSVSLPMQVRKNFYLVFKESITNLIKYSGATRVSILLTEKNKTILLIIRDNGKGIPVNAETQGNGLMNMKRRAEEIHANLNIISGNGEGTGIELALKTY